MKRHKDGTALRKREFSLPVVDELRRLGHDTLTIQEIGRGNQAVPDEEVLAFAVSQNRALLTLNRKHFVRLHNAQPDHSGIIVCTVDPDFTGQAAEFIRHSNRSNTLTGSLSASTVL